MKFAIATYHVPHPDGTAAGRQLWALAEALRADGHLVEGWCWGPGGSTLTPPDWCAWSPQVAPRGGAARLRTLLHPRSASARGGWRPDTDAVRWADEWGSWPAVHRAGGTSLLTVHYDVSLDIRAAGRWSAGRVQDWRAQHRAVRGATVTVALSERVAAATGVQVTVPATLPVPEEPLPLQDEPVALMLADWSWAPNAIALGRLLDAWPSVRARVPGAELLVAGRGSADVGSVAGVRVLGEVGRTVDAMAEAALLAFPCPPTSGPKMKVLDACAAGLPVVTTAAGAEGLRLPAGSVAIADDTTFVDVLVGCLQDTERRAAMAETARRAVLEHHAPAVAARARVALFD